MVGVVSLWLAWRLVRRDDPLAFGLLAAAALLLYPGVLTPYGMLMMIPVAQLCGRVWGDTRGAFMAAAFVAVLYYVDSLMPFAAHAMAWSAACLWAVCSDAPDRAGRLEAR
jgi:hypothetical protein